MTVCELAIETKDLTCKFGDFTAVDRLNIKVYSGEIYGFLGSNGSGKSTSIRMLCGILKPAGGTGIVLGKLRKISAICRRSSACTLI